jgi:hypothetical protein
MMEFATFPKATQRYIRRSLDVAAGHGGTTRRWSRDDAEGASIREQNVAYRRLDEIRGLIPDHDGVDAMTRLLGPLVAVSAFDLAEGRLTSFASYRFLYERIIGASIRPWLPAAFCAAAALPHLSPSLRRTLLQSLSEPAMTAPGWSICEPAFIPEWVEKVDTTIAA